MDIIIVGGGRLARELNGHPSRFGEARLHRWPESPAGRMRSIVVHAGSGRELAEVATFCAATGSPLLELSTEPADFPAHGFPWVACANANLLMLKFMAMLRRSGSLLASYEVSLTESHQAAKQSVPGTAVHLAASLGLQPSRIRSIRDPARQGAELGISPAGLERHAFHEVVVRDGACTLRLQSLVDGEAPYVDGVASIVRAMFTHPLENRRYDVAELLENGWV